MDKNTKAILLGTAAIALAFGFLLLMQEAKKKAAAAKSAEDNKAGFANASGRNPFRKKAFGNSISVNKAEVPTNSIMDRPVRVKS